MINKDTLKDSNLDFKDIYNEKKGEAYLSTLEIQYLKMLLKLLTL
jgi:hypothetical protein